MTCTHSINENSKDTNNHSNCATVNVKSYEPATGATIQSKANVKLNLQTGRSHHCRNGYQKVIFEKERGREGKSETYLKVRAVTKHIGYIYDLPVQALIFGETQTLQRRTVESITLVTLQFHPVDHDIFKFRQICNKVVLQCF